MMEQTKTKTSSLISSTSMFEDIEKEAQELYPSLPKAMEGTILELSLCNGIWHPTGLVPLRSLLFFQKYFQAHDQDIILASAPKCGTTWLKSLTFSIINRSRFTQSNTPLLNTNPHFLVPSLVSHLFAGTKIPDLTTIPSPRLLHTHLPYSALPESMKQSNCLIVYICRNPFDSAVSLWHHNCKMQKDFEMPLEEFVEQCYFKGISWFGPYWDNVLGYWNESLHNPNKVLFLKYEDMKEDSVSCLKRIAKFIRYPFSEKEERDGVIEEILNFCSLKKLQNLEVNKNGVHLTVMPYKAFFRKGNVGDGVDLLSPAVTQKLQNVMEEKLKGSNLSFKLSI